MGRSTVIKKELVYQYLMWFQPFSLRDPKMVPKLFRGPNLILNGCYNLCQRLLWSRMALSRASGPV